MHKKIIDENMDRYRKVFKCGDLSDQQKEDVIRSLVYILDHFVEEAFRKTQNDHELSSVCEPGTGYKREDYQFSSESLKRTRTSNRLKYKQLLQKTKKKR